MDIEVCVCVQLVVSHAGKHAARCNMSAALIECHLLHLSENDIAFPLNGMVLKARVLQDVCQDVHSCRNILLEDLGIVAGLLPRGVCIQVCSKVLNLYLKLLDTPLLQHI